MILLWQISNDGNTASDSWLRSMGLVTGTADGAEDRNAPGGRIHAIQKAMAALVSAMSCVVHRMSRTPALYAIAGMGHHALEYRWPHYNVLQHGNAMIVDSCCDLRQKKSKLDCTTC